MAEPGPRWRFLPHSLGCYICGEANPLGLQRRFLFREDGAVETEFLPQMEHCGYQGIVHGGILGALLDETMGWACCVRGGRLCLTADLRLRFLRSVPRGRKIIVRGEAVERRQGFWRAQGQIRDEEGTLFVRGEGLYSPMSRERTEEILRCLLFDEDTLPAEAILKAGDGEP